VIAADLAKTAVSSAEKLSELNRAYIQAKAHSRKPLFGEVLDLAARNSARKRTTKTAMGGEVPMLIFTCGILIADPLIAGSIAFDNWNQARLEKKEAKNCNENVSRILEDHRGSQHAKGATGRTNAYSLREFN
jgi:hypothetical protein